MKKIEINKDEVLEYHKSKPSGKISVISSKPIDSLRELSMAYTPGVAIPSMEISKDSQKSYDYTSKGNLVGVISNGTAVLGLGDIGPDASKPVMEGKAVLLKKLSGIDAFDIEINSKSVDDMVLIISSLSPTFGAINLEDIKAPECFEIERRVIDAVDIPVMHDDQHGTAIVTSAAFMNALEISAKKVEDIKIVVNGAGAAAIACTKMYIELGVKHENVVMCDSKGVIRKDKATSDIKAQFATERDIYTLEEAIKGADMFLGVSKKDILTVEMIKSMAKDPIVFALANPDPEIEYSKAKASREDIIFATGRSDYPNQVNNVLGFPYIFRGALDTRSKAINTEMKISAARAIASLAKESCKNCPEFGREYILPNPLDKRLLAKVSIAVAKAAVETGVARKTILNWDDYEKELNERV